jgi:tetratricopeptide (TPR) repeat protein
MKFGGRPKDAAKLIEALRKAAEYFPNDDAAQLTYARAEVTWGDRAKGEQVLQLLIDKNPKAVEARVRLAESRMASAPQDPAGRRTAFRQAGEILGKAAAIDPDNYQVLYRFAQTRTVEADYPSENTFNALMKAVSLAPQVSALRITAGEVALKRGRPDIAWSILVPVATDVHGGADVTKAQQLLAEASAARPYVSPPVKKEERIEQAAPPTTVARPAAP